MTDPRLKRLADVLVNYSTKVKPGDWVMLRGSTVAEPLVNEVYRELIKAGSYVTLDLANDTISEAYMKEANEDQLNWVSPTTKMLYEKANVLIAIDGASNTRALSGVDPKNQQTRAIATRGLTETYLERAAKKDLRWVITRYPCPSFAQEADMSLSDYEDFVYSACFCDKDDPVAEWIRVHDEQQKVVDWLKGRKLVTVNSPNAELTLSIEGRTFVNADGENNMPSGEVFTGPVEDSCNGWVEFTYPAISGGREVEGVRLEFKDGKVVKATAENNKELLLQTRDTDSGSRYLGEFAIGTNTGITQFTKQILFDEKIGGSFHLALGAGYPDTGSVNQSAIHWDMVCDMRAGGEIWVDGELLYKDGAFAIEL